MNVTVATEQVREMFGWIARAAGRSKSQARRRARAGCFSCPISTASARRTCRTARGVLHGLTTDNMTPAHLARATMEGVTLGLAYGLRPLPRTRRQAHRNPAHRRRQQKRDLAADRGGYFRRADRLPLLQRRRGARRGDAGGMGAREHHRKTHLAGDDCEPHYKARPAHPRGAGEKRGAALRGDAEPADRSHAQAARRAYL